MSFLQFVYRNVARSKRTYAAYFLSSAFSVMIFFICALFLFSPYTPRAADLPDRDADDDHRR
ncbi:hypothetical protein, partial [Paenibacillus sp. AR247]|uniref:hypothetical protein n=1 Tax=Paenibacillus sp. AR247 TaxID=1631599 RepID=UPI002157D8B8